MLNIIISLWHTVSVVYWYKQGACREMGHHMHLALTWPYMSQTHHITWFVMFTTYIDNVWQSLWCVWGSDWHSRNHDCIELGRYTRLRSGCVRCIDIARAVLCTGSVCKMQHIWTDVGRMQKPLAEIPRSATASDFLCTASYPVTIFADICRLECRQHRQSCRG